jgi:hypothetical protein
MDKNKTLNFIKNIKETCKLYMSWCGCRLAPLTLHTFYKRKERIYIAQVLGLIWCNSLLSITYLQLWRDEHFMESTLLLS